MTRQGNRIKLPIMRYDLIHRPSLLQCPLQLRHVALTNCLENQVSLRVELRVETGAVPGDVSKGLEPGIPEEKEPVVVGGLGPGVPHVGTEAEFYAVVAHQEWAD